jgi:hypothetical protein
MTCDSPSVLESVHRKTGDILRLCTRLMAAMICFGTVFSILVIMGMTVARYPERLLQVQAFMFNYNEFSHSEHALKTESSAIVSPKAGLSDPNWDGMLAGAGIGFTIGRDIPLVGFVVAPIAGAFLGYQLDKKI